MFAYIMQELIQLQEEKPNTPDQNANPSSDATDADVALRAEAAESALRDCQKVTQLS